MIKPVDYFGLFKLDNDAIFNWCSENGINVTNASKCYFISFHCTKNPINSFYNNVRNCFILEKNRN